MFFFPLNHKSLKKEQKSSLMLHIIFPFHLHDMAPTEKKRQYSFLNKITVDFFFGNSKKFLPTFVFLFSSREQSAPISFFPAEKRGMGNNNEKSLSLEFLPFHFYGSGCKIHMKAIQH